MFFLPIENYLVLTQNEKENMKRCLPNIEINQEPLLIAGSNRHFGPGNGMWEIQSEQIRHFQNRRFWQRKITLLYLIQEGDGTSVLGGNFL